MIRIGTAGWSYMSGKGKWAGVFYPKATSDPLEFYSRFFETVEVNSTFYRPIDDEVAERWAQKAPEGFKFSIKLFQKFTHPKMYKDATGEAADVQADDFESFIAANRSMLKASWARCSRSTRQASSGRMRPWTSSSGSPSS